MKFDTTMGNYRAAHSIEFHEMKVDANPKAIDLETIYYSSFHTGETYHMNFRTFTCTCWEFDSIRNACPPTDIRRYCRHLLEFICKYDDFEKFLNPSDPIVLFAIENVALSRHSISSRATFNLGEVDSNKMLLISSPTDDYINVITRKHLSRDATVCTGDLMRYSYNQKLRRWSWGNAPYNPVPIKKWIRKLDVGRCKQAETPECNHDKLMAAFLTIPESEKIYIDLYDSFVNHVSINENLNLAITILEKIEYQSIYINDSSLEKAWKHLERKLDN